MAWSAWQLSNLFLWHGKQTNYQDNYFSYIVMMSYFNIFFSTKYEENTETEVCPKEDKGMIEKDKSKQDQWVKFLSINHYIRLDRLKWDSNPNT